MVNLKQNKKVTLHPENSKLCRSTI